MVHKIRVRPNALAAGFATFRDRLTHLLINDFFLTV